MKGIIPLRGSSFKMQIPLEELTNNTIERNLVVNWSLRSTSSLASRTIGYREKLFSLREEVNFVRSEEARPIGVPQRTTQVGVVGGKVTDRGEGIVSRTESNFSVVSPGFRLARTASHALPNLPVNSVRAEMHLLSQPAHMEKACSHCCVQQFQVSYPLLTGSDPTPFSLWAFLNSSLPFS